MPIFRQLHRSEYPLIHPIMQAVIAEEEALILPCDATEQHAIAYWFGNHPKGEVWVAEEEGEILGSYYQRPNQPGLGRHIANGGYIVSPTARGRGIGRLLGEHSLTRAREQGYYGLQYNFVVSTNEPAVNLWQSLGFAIIGTIPGGYHRKQADYVDAYIMFKDLSDA